MDMGFGGVSLSKPGGGGTLINSTNDTLGVTTTTAEPEQMNPDVYDLVEEKVTPSTNLFNNSVKYI